MPEVPASGSIAGYEVAGPVDSVLARDYLEGRRLPPELAERRQLHLVERTVPTRRELAWLSEKYSPDVATLLLIETWSRLADTSRLRTRYEAELDSVHRWGIEAAWPEIPDDLLVLVAPGWFYKSHGAETNGDLRVQRALFARFGLPTRLIEVKENGTVEENAAIIAEAIREESKQHRLLLVSASKGGPEVAQALGRELDPVETQAVLGWLSIGGVVRGSPFADRILEPDMCWFVRLKLGWDGFDLEGAKSMQTTRAGKAFEKLRFPEHIRMIAFIPVPLSGHITERGAFGYRVLRPHGPNDGLTLLTDEQIPGSTPLLVPGIDHFLEDTDLDAISVALLRLVLAETRRPAVSP